MSAISKKFLEAVKNGREFSVRYRWGETFQGQTDWTEWDKGVLAFLEKANPDDEPGITILDETGWGFASREKELEKAFGLSKDKGEAIFGRYAAGGNEHLLQVVFEQ
jgi:hypothetical protein